MGRSSGRRLWEPGPVRGKGWRQGERFLRIPGRERWDRGLKWNLGTPVGSGVKRGPAPTGHPCAVLGADLTPPPRPSVKQEGCVYLVAPTLGVHKHQQGLHEGGRGGPDDEGFPAALLGGRESW